VEAVIFVRSATRFDGAKRQNLGKIVGIGGPVDLSNKHLEEFNLDSLHEV
jgi:hypothetical protein